jgi:hypothetical protein
MAQCESKLIKMYEAGAGAAGAPAPAAPPPAPPPAPAPRRARASPAPPLCRALPRHHLITQGSLGETVAASRSSASLLASTLGGEANASGYNVRVTLDGSPAPEDEDDEDEEDGLEPEIPDRAMMKKLHGMMLDKANAKGKKKKKKFETGGAPAAAAPKGAGSRGGRSLA